MDDKNLDQNEANLEANSTENSAENNPENSAENSTENSTENTSENDSKKGSNPFGKKGAKDGKKEAETVDSKSRKFFARFFGKKVANEEPEITKGQKFENLHSNFHREKEKEPDPDTFPKKCKIMTWQEEQLLGVNVEDVDLELQEEIDNLAKEVNAKS